MILSYLDNLHLVPGGKMVGVGRGSLGHRRVVQTPQLNTQQLVVPLLLDSPGLLLGNLTPQLDSPALLLGTQSLLGAWLQPLGGNLQDNQPHLLELLQDIPVIKLESQRTKINKYLRTYRLTF